MLSGILPGIRSRTFTGIDPGITSEEIPSEISAGIPDGAHPGIPSVSFIDDILRFFPVDSL